MNFNHNVHVSPKHHNFIRKTVLACQDAPDQMKWKWAFAHLWQVYVSLISLIKFIENVVALLHDDVNIRPANIHFRSCVICRRRLVRGGYEDIVTVCSIKQETASGTVRYFHAMVPGDDCNWVNRYVSASVRTEVRAGDRMYVTLEHDRVYEAPRRFMATLCKGYGDLLYGTVSTDGAYCQPNDQEMRRFAFFAFGGGKYP